MLPEIDPAQAEAFVVSVGLLWANAWIFVQIRNLIDKM